MDQWAALAAEYRGWGLTEIQNLTPRERINWMNLARGRGGGSV